jgi:hypothetical protein
MITVNFNGLNKILSSALKAQVPQATAKSLTQVAFDCRTVLQLHEHSDLHLTRKFIPSQTQVEMAKPTNLRSEVGLTDRVTFGVRLVDGGSRSPQTSKYIAVPISVKRNKRGGITKAQKPSALLNKPGHFLKEINGIKGIWVKQKSGKLELEYVLKPVTTYNEAPYLDFEHIVLRFVSVTKWEEKLMRNLLKSIGVNP